MTNDWRLSSLESIVTITIILVTAIVTGAIVIELATGLPARVWLLGY